MTEKKRNKFVPPLQEFHDACGIGFIAELSAEPSRRVIELSIEALTNMSHRGASGSDERSSDGTGLLTDLPVEYFKLVLDEELNTKIYEDAVAVSMVFTTEQELASLTREIVALSKELRINYVGVRNVPTNKAILGDIARNTCPLIVQYFFTDVMKSDDFESRLYLLRKSIEQKIAETSGETFICSLSSKTIVYKGMMKPHNLARFYPDLNQPEFKAKVSLFHERFSTNTISTWSMAQPFRMLGHNGEINTIKGNRLWMQTREATIQSNYWNSNLKRLKPIVSQSGSDSYSLDNILEFLVRSGRSLFHSAMMLIPEPYVYDSTMPQELKDFYVYHENHIEPWDGPAALVFTDGEIVGAKLDRNGLRPLRYTRTKDGLVVMASEAGVVDIEESNILMHHHMKAGENFAIKLDGSGIIPNNEIVKIVSSNGKYSRMIRNNLSALERGNPEAEFGNFGLPEEGFDKRLRLGFGVDKEDLERILFPMAQSAKESISSMGDDTPPALISTQNRRLYDYFKQHFAQVTNPPIDSIRERYVMSLYRYIGSESDLLNDEDVFKGAIRIDSPVLSPHEVQLLKEKNDSFPHVIINCHFNLNDDLAQRIEEIRNECKQAVLIGTKIIFLSDEDLQKDYAPIPMLLIVSAVHQYLIKEKLRNQIALLCFAGDVIEDHHIACLVGFGASAVYPYMAYELIRENFADDNWVEKMHNYRTALEKGLLKIMSKMGISTVSSYHGSMLFNAIGISEQMINEYFPTIKSTLGGLNTKILQEFLSEQSKKAFEQEYSLEEIGRFRFRKGGEAHGFSPTVFKQIHNVSQKKEHATNPEGNPVYVRDLLEVKKKEAIALDSVESVENIVKRFGLGAISFGAISEETHRTLARAATMLGMRSNTGEGGEQKDRYSISNPDKSENCFTKQVASARFGVTTSYLTAARELQIKIGQGAKPGEGGQLPGEKVTLSIANNRYTTPGVALISPPPHHDIYSIEDLAQLIYDLRQVNPRANICVKLVSQFGIGIIASGVVKAGADTILISGNDGGTGASPIGSLKHTGLPWEIGLSEVHRTLIQNDLRNRVTLRVDGGLKNAHDIVTAAMLGAEEFDFGTSALVSLGCVMARQCHLNTCPTGIATQDEELRKKFKGKPEHLVNFIRNIAENIRRELSELGLKGLDEAVGRNDLLAAKTDLKKYIKSKNIDLSVILNHGLAHKFSAGTKEKHSSSKNGKHIDESVIAEVLQAIMTHGRAIVTRKLKNTDRAIGARLSGLISFLYGPSEFKGNIQYRLEGAAGQSFGAFLVDNIELRHCGVANDYVGKGMSGGLITIRFPRTIRKSLEGNTIIGNVALYGATGGELFIAGRAGERFAVRNSGAAAVVEGVGNHGCEYMTRGFVIILGEIGKNFGAGMTGGRAFIYTTDTNLLEKNLNREYVKTEAMKITDEDLVLKYIVNHQFHTGSTIAETILNNWETEKYKFVKVIPLAMSSVDYTKIYEQQFKDRLQGVFNI